MGSSSQNRPTQNPIVSEYLPETEFMKREVVVTKTASQRHLISQLNSLTYFLIGYQFVRYCYSSCLPPLFLHVVIQQLLSVGEITGNSRGSRVLFSEAVSFQERNAQTNGTSFSRSTWINQLLAKLCLFIYWKFAAVVVWHTLFVFMWLQDLGMKGHLDDVTYGSWYCISFMGENAPSFSPLDGWWLRLWKLGLFELILCDVAILTLQLCLFQCVYLQLTISPKGIALGEQEVYILRVLSGGAQGTVPVNMMGIPYVLYIRLFQMFDRDSFQT